MFISELTNEEKRRDFLRDYKSWEKIAEDEFGERAYYIYDDPALDKVICVEERKVTKTDYSAGFRGGKHPYPTYEGVDIRYALLIRGRHYHDCIVSITEVIRYLKRKCRELREEEG